MPQSKLRSTLLCPSEMWWPPTPQEDLPVRIKLGVVKNKTFCWKGLSLFRTPCAADSERVTQTGPHRQSSRLCLCPARSRASCPSGVTRHPHRGPPEQPGLGRGGHREALTRLHPKQPVELLSSAAVPARSLARRSVF